jgi:hypothetical protein
MSDPISTTRIADLPENVTIQIPQQYGLPPAPAGPPPPQIVGSNAQNQQIDMGQNTYVPLNIHPNPYGVQQQDPTLPLPQNIQQRGQNQVPQGQMSGQGQMQGLDPAAEVQYKLPSRDIPMNTLAYQNDDAIQPNFVPKAKLTADYIREYEEASEARLKEHEQKKHREAKADSWFAALQTPILIAILYFLFQLPIVTTIMYKYFAFLKIHNADGNLNLAGLIMKSVAFGLMFYGLQSAADNI